MAQASKIVLLSDPRTGSTGVYQILTRHPAIDLLEEPFNENYVRWAPGNEDYRAPVRDISSLDATVDRIFSGYDGFKLQGYQLYDDEVGGLPCDLSDDLMGHLLRRPDVRVVFLSRLNILQSVVSNLIAGQTGVWQPWDLPAPIAEVYSSLEALDQDDVRRRVRWLADHVARCEVILAEFDGSKSHRIIYERLYLSDPGEQAVQLQQLWAFLGVPPLAFSEVESILDPTVRLNSRTTYDFVPNIAEINKGCGSDDFGWLFESHRGASQDQL